MKNRFTPSRRGLTSQAWLVSTSSLAICAVLVGLLVWNPDSRPAASSGSRLVFYCAAGIKPPVEAVVREYQQKYGVSIEMQYGGSGTLLSNLRVVQRGDLYLAADSSYIELARARQLVDEAIPLARVRAVIAFRRGNPKQIESLDDLLRDDVAVALANPDAASVGKVTQQALQQSGHWESLKSRAKVFKPTVNEVANDVKLGAVDAGIIWDATANQYPDLEMLSVPVFDERAQEITIAVLKSCRQPSAALHFARYLGAPDRGLEQFGQAGYEPVDGDTWAETPEITLFSGGVNRLAIQDTLKRFEQREGVKVNVVYNGCGILTGMIRGGKQPDAYFACDVPYMDQVADVFLDPRDLSETRVVLLVPRGNPRNLRSLDDLAGPDLKLGVANEEQSALGALTRRLLEQAGLYDRVSPNVRSYTPTADLLVNQMRTGSLDVALVYEANTMHVGDELEIVRLPQGEAKAVQPIAVARNSQQKYLSGRLMDAISSESSQRQFESTGFRWLGGSQ